MFQTQVKGFSAKIRDQKNKRLLASLDPDGELAVYPYYLTDGATGPTYHNLEIMAGAIAHDVLYQMLRDNLLFSADEFEDSDFYYLQFVWYRFLSDSSFIEICEEHGMSEFRQNYVWWFVEKFGEKHALPQELKQ